MNYYNEIKEQLINNEINRKVKNYSMNKNDLVTYYNVGKLLVEARGGEEKSRYCDKLIVEYSKRLTQELGKGYSSTNLKYMRKFFIFQKGQPLVDQLSWSHYIILLSIQNENKINYYVDQILKRNLSKRQLKDIIKNNEYERLPKETKVKLINKEKSQVTDLIKNPILIKNNKYENVSEKVLQRLILEDIPSFLEELGSGFTFIKNEYKIRIGDRYNYIDLLLFNYEYNCFVLIELKVTELKKEHIGQIEFYMNYVDKHLKRINQDKTIGIIICKKNNKFVMEYCSDKRILAKEYELIK